MEPLDAAAFRVMNRPLSKASRSSIHGSPSRPKQKISGFSFWTGHSVLVQEGGHDPRRLGDDLDKTYATLFYYIVAM
jgi:hypothetical protein